MNNQNAVNMVWHDYERIHFYICEMCWDFHTTFADNATKPIQTHFVILDFTKYAFMTMRTNGHEICAFLGIVVIFQAEGTALVLLCSVCQL